MRARIAAAYAVSGSKAGVAREFDVSEASVRRILRETSVTAFDDIKKEAVEEAARDYMRERTEEAKTAIRMCLSELIEGGKLREAKARDLAVTLGVLMDKFGLSGADVLGGSSDAGGGVIMMPQVLEDPDADHPMIEVQDDG